MVSKKNSTLENKARAGMLSGQDNINFNENYINTKKKARSIHSSLNEKTKGVYKTFFCIIGR